MNRPTVLSALVIAIFALAALGWAGTQVSWAAAPGPQQLVVIVADSDAIHQSDKGVGLTKSFIGLVATLQEDQPFIFIGSDDPSYVLGPFGAGDTDFRRKLVEIEARLMSPRPQDSEGLAEALAEAHTLLSTERAAAGSTLYVLTGSSSKAEFGPLSNRLVPLVTRFAKNGWSINGISLPDASSEAQKFLGSLSNNSGGQLFDLSVSDGFRNLADGILAEGSRGSLATLGRRALTPNEIMSSVVSVAPGTHETKILFFKESPDGSLRLSNPSGFEASAGDRAAFSVLETPHVVIWSLIDPAPGNWRVDARGVEGLITAWEYSLNKYSLVLQSSTLIPTNVPETMVAYVTEGDGAVVLEGVRLYANITTPEGATLVHQMNDEGIDGDATAGDGYFTMTVPQLSVEGDYQVELELSWIDYNHRITSYGAFKAQAFPTIEVRPAQLQGLVAGERTQVATVFIHVQGQPYPVAADQLTASLASPADQKGALELEPQRLFGTGPAWEYNVYFTPEGEGSYTQMFQLSLEYAGRSYTQISDSIVLSAVAIHAPPPAPVDPVVEEPAPVAPPQSVPVSRAPLAPVPLPQPERSGFSWLALALPIVLLIGAAAAAVYLLTRALPYGYLYNDKGVPLADFANIKRHPILRFVFRGLVRGSDLNVPGMEGLVFHFTKKGISLRNLRGQPTVRVNNEPLVGQAAIEDQTWIGTAGKLFNFSLSPTSAPEGASAD